MSQTRLPERAPLRAPHTPVYSLSVLRSHPLTAQAEPMSSPTGMLPLTKLLRTWGNMSRSLPYSRTKSRAGRALAYALGDPPAIPAQVGGSTLYLRPAGRTTGEPFWNGRYEEHVVGMLIALTTPSSVFLDVGANVGLIGIRVANHMKRTGGGKVFFFEPVPSNLDLLNMSLQANDLAGTGTVLEVALSDSAGAIDMTVEGRGHRSGNAWFTEPDQATARRLTETVRVDKTRLDDLTDNHPEILSTDLVKMDVEGSETAVLRGGMTVISRALPIIYGEFAGGEGLPGAYGLLAALGYRIFAFKTATCLEEVESAPGRGDVFLVPPARIHHLVTACNSLSNGGVRFAD